MDERLPNRFPLLPPPPQAFQIRLKRTAGRRLWEGELNLIFSVLNRPNYDFWSLSDMNSFSGDCVQAWISAMWLVLTKYVSKCGWKWPGSQKTDGDVCPNYKQESCSPADAILGSCWVKAALYEPPRKKDKGGGWGGLQCRADKELETHWGFSEFGFKYLKSFFLNQTVDALENVCFIMTKSFSSLLASREVLHI